MKDSGKRSEEAQRKEKRWPTYRQFPHSLGKLASLYSVPLCSHSGPNKHFPVRRPQSRSHFHAWELRAWIKSFSWFHVNQNGMQAPFSHTLRRFQLGHAPCQVLGGGGNSGSIATKAISQACMSFLPHLFPREWQQDWVFFLKGVVPGPLLCQFVERCGLRQMREPLTSRHIDSTLLYYCPQSPEEWRH